MKVTFFVHCFFPDHFYGTETYTLELAKHYQSKGIEVHVVTAIFPGEPAASDLVTQYQFQGIQVTCIDKNHLPNTRVKDTYYQADMRPILTRVLSKIRPDLVHVTHLINHTGALLEVTQELGIPTYATFTDFFGFCFNNKLEASDGSLCAGPSPNRTNCMACYIKASGQNPQAGKMHRLSARPGLAQLAATGANLARKFPPLRGGPVDGLLEDLARRPDTLLSLYSSAYRATVAPTHFLRGAYERNGFKTPMRSIWFGVDIERRPKPRRPAGHKPVIGFIGQIARHKGPDILIEAFRRLPNASAQLHIYGPPDQEPSFMKTLEELAADAPVTFHGTFAKEKMHEVLESMDVLVIPSRWYENSPLVLLNALATHTPVVVADVAGMTEFLESGVNGLSFERGSVDDLDRVLTQLLRDPELLYNMSLTTNFERTPASMAEETIGIYSH
ncbi:MAG TPA: glycosyltransferase family 4 protein [Burkholderiaceae bacterium]|jgi:glycosyltransferase involved in cell wall biosynthesis|nr:glycosyltransferase family 4 protein [Burkholderiaceae bacterium]